jgi:hypothetical protein
MAKWARFCISNRQEMPGSSEQGRELRGLCIPRSLPRWHDPGPLGAVLSPATILKAPASTIFFNLLFLAPLPPLLHHHHPFGSGLSGLSRLSGLLACPWALGVWPCAVGVIADRASGRTSGRASGRASGSTSVCASAAGGNPHLAPACANLPGKPAWCSRERAVLAALSAAMRCTSSRAVLQIYCLPQLTTPLSCRSPTADL